MRVTESQIDEVRQRTDIVELISSYGVSLQSTGSGYKACCPFHNEKTPSFHVNPSNGFYHCFGCGESGTVITFVQKQEGLTFMEALRKLAEKCGVKLEEKEDLQVGKRNRLYALMLELSQFYNRCLTINEAKAAREYLAKRDLNENAQKEFLIGYAPKSYDIILKWAKKYKYTFEELVEAGILKPSDRPGGRPYHYFGGRLVFTIKDRQGRVVAFSGRQLVEKKNSGKYVNSPDTIIFKKSKVLFAFDRAAAKISRSPKREAIICEGQIDTIRLHLCGFNTACAAQGTAFTSFHTAMLKNVADCATLIYDDDAAGHKATIRTARMLLYAGLPVRTVSLPNGDDPDSFLRKNGPEKLQAMIDNAQSIIRFQYRVLASNEQFPNSIDAVNRISNALLETIACCSSAILQATMLNEAAEALKLPLAALQATLESTKIPSKIAAEYNNKGRSADTPPEDDDDLIAADSLDYPLSGEDGHPIAAFPSDSTEKPFKGYNARMLEPPSAREFAFLGFLLDNEQNDFLPDLVSDLLPGEVFANEFTRRFVRSWLDSHTSNDDCVKQLGESLSFPEDSWFRRVITSEIGKSNACALPVLDIFQNFVRALWIKHIRTERGNMVDNGSEDFLKKRMELTLMLKKLDTAPWENVEQAIRQFERKK